MFVKRLSGPGLRWRLNARKTGLGEIREIMSRAIQ